MKRDVTINKYPTGIYVTVEREVKGNLWSVMFVYGVSNYINIRMLTNNPFRGTGKDFKNFEQAARSYKSAEMKTMLLLAEIDIKAAIVDFEVNRMVLNN